MSPLLYQLSYRARGATLAPLVPAHAGGMACSRYPTVSDSLRPRMLLIGSEALGQTLALLVTFVGIGVVANVLILYVVGQVLAERKQNQEREPGADF